MQVSLSHSLTHTEKDESVRVMTFSLFIKLLTHIFYVYDGIYMFMLLRVLSITKETR